MIKTTFNGKVRQAVGSFSFVSINTAKQENFQQTCFSSVNDFGMVNHKQTTCKLTKKGKLIHITSIINKHTGNVVERKFENFN